MYVSQSAPYFSAQRASSLGIENHSEFDAPDGVGGGFARLYEGPTPLL